MKSAFKGRGYVYYLQYHVVWCVKKCREVLDETTEQKLTVILNKISEDNNFKILSVKCNRYYVHLVIECTPQNYIPDVIKALKGVSARLLIKELGEDLRKKLPEGHLWNPNYFIATISENTEEQLKIYIENQKINS